jgi:ribulose-bisphosphate carboxylase large chain
VSRIRATYWIETPLDPGKAAQSIAGEQSSGTFVAVPGETEELKSRFAARVESVKALETAAQPSLPGARPAGAGRYHRAEVTISWPAENVGDNLPVLVSTLQGNLYELAQLSGIRLLDFDVPADFAGRFSGPAFGVGGTRRCANVFGRPLVGTIIKPSIGLSPDDTAALVRQLLAAGIDFIKDDELMGNPPHSPFEARTSAVLRETNDHAQRTGKQALYAANISDEPDRMQRNYDHLVKLGGVCAMVSLNTVGLAGVMKISRQGALVLHGHRNGFGMLHRHPATGMEFTAYQKLWRLAGVDQLHVNGIANKFWEPDDSVVRSIGACLKPWHRLDPLLPVVSSGQWGGQAWETWRRTRTPDLLYLAGGGIMAHPMGPAAGVSAIRQAWQCAMEGVPPDEAAARFPELGEAIRKFGGGAG